MSSLEAALYNYALEESWDARLRKWKEATTEQVTEQRTRVRDIRDRLLHLIQDADDEGNRDHATVTTYAYLQSKERLIIARQEQRRRRNNPDAALEVERDLLGTLIRVVEPYVPPGRRMAMEAFLTGQNVARSTAAEPEQEAQEEPEDEAPTVDVNALLAERERLAQRVEAMEEARRRLEVELGTYDPLAIVELVRKTRDRLTEAERLLSPLALERDALSREFGTFTAVQIIGQVRLLKDKNSDLNQQLRFARSRAAAAGARVETPATATSPSTAAQWEVERIQIERAVALLEDVLELGGTPVSVPTIPTLPTIETDDQELQPLPAAA